MVFGKRPNVKEHQQLLLMRRAGLVVAEALQRCADTAEPGMTTTDLDAVAAAVIASHGAKPSFLGYFGYPATICVSVNEEIVHGIPGGRVLREGDLVSIDCGAIVEGWHGDAAVTVFLGDVSSEHRRLSDVTREALWSGLAAAVPGHRVGHIGAAVEASVRGSQVPGGPEYGIVADYVGHGIGTEMHMDPPVPNLGPARTGPRLRAGMALAVEPMVTMGAPSSRVLDDDWTVVTLDGGVAAHWEHTVAITEEGPWVLTAVDGGAEKFAAMGVPSPAGKRG